MTEDSSPKRLKSPPYPFVSLPKAVERIGQLFPKAQHFKVGLGVLADAWGYGLKSSGLVQTAAALIQFGLLADEGAGDKRKFQLTKEALRIVQDDPTSVKWVAAIQQVALTPKIYLALWEEFKGASVSDVALKNFLTLDRMDAGGSPFSAGAVADIVAGYKESLTFAGIVPGGAMPSPETGAPIDDTPIKPQKSFEIPVLDESGKTNSRGGEREIISGLLGKNTTFRLMVRGHVGVKEIERLISKLEVDKEILAEADETAEPDDLI